MNHRPVEPSWIIITALTAFLIGTYAFVLLALPALYLNDFRARQSTLTSIQTMLNTSGSLLYGVVTAVDPEAGTFSVRLFNPLDPTNPTTITFTAAQDAVITRQTLIEENGIVTGLSQGTSATLADMQVGDKAAIEASRSSGGLVASYIVLGDPL